MDRQKKIRIYSFLAATIIGASSLSGCSKKAKEEEKAKEVLEQVNEYNNYEGFAKFRIINNEAVMCYRGENIFLAIDKQTNEISRYISNEKTFKDEVYNLETGEFVYLSAFGIDDYGKDNYNNLFENYDIVYFHEINDYIENEFCKDWYTYDEIKELEPQILDAVIKIREAKKLLVKTK